MAGLLGKTYKWQGTFGIDPDKYHALTYEEKNERWAAFHYNVAQIELRDMQRHLFEMKRQWDDALKKLEDKRK